MIRKTKIDVDLFLEDCQRQVSHPQSLPHLGFTINTGSFTKLFYTIHYSFAKFCPGYIQHATYTSSRTDPPKILLKSMHVNILEHIGLVVRMSIFDTEVDGSNPSISMFSP